MTRRLASSEAPSTAPTRTPLVRRANVAGSASPRAPSPGTKERKTTEAERETFEVLRRAALHWDRSRIGAPTRTITDVARLPMQRAWDGSNQSVLDARGVPVMRQELLRLTWWSLYACRPHEYALLGQLDAALVAPRLIVRQTPPGALATNVTVAELAALRANLDVERCNALARAEEVQQQPRLLRVPHSVDKTVRDEDIGEQDDSFFFNATCRRFVQGLLRQASPASAWCHFRQEPARALYRLGDIVERAKHQGNGTKAHNQILRDFNSSIAAEYLRANRHGVNNIRLLRAILNRRFANETPLEAVVHIRAGDTIDAPSTSAMQFLCDRNSLGLHASNPPYGGTYVKPLCYYESVVESLRRSGVGNVVLLAGNHNPKGTAGPRKSCAYIRVVGELMQARGLRVVYGLSTAVVPEPCLHTGSL